jgi:hypothetical protein
MLRLAAFLFAIAAFAQAPRMNQIQVLGSHNSYKQAIDPSLLSMLRETMGERIKGLEYSHRPLTEQLDLGLRSLELDVVHDPEGGRYANPSGIQWVKERGLPAGPPYDPEGLMKKPGLKILHVQDIDFRTHCYTLQQALAELKAWSDRNPRHVPIVVTMNAKSDVIDRPGFTKPLPFDKAAYDAWDAEIRAGLPVGKLITPDTVRGAYPTLEAAALAHNWPELDAARGKFLFVLDEGAEKSKPYIEGHPSLKGRMMFTNSEPGQPEAAFIIMNDPIRDLARIQHLVRSGYLVRTRADADTREARQGDYKRWHAARASGAQVISTDYYQPDPALGTGYQVRMPGGGVALWNPELLPAMRPLPPVEPKR